MKSRITMGILGLAVLLDHSARAQSILGSTGDYAVMAGSTVTNTGSAATINGNLGTTGLTGSITYTPTGTLVSPITAQNQTDFTAAFNGLAAMTPTANLTGLTLGTTAGAITLTPGVYKFDATAQLTGTLILDAQNQSNAVWVFQIGTTFGTTAGSAVTIINPAGGSVGSNGIFWQIGGATTIGASTTLNGNFLGGTTFSFGSGATITSGRVLAGSAGGTIGLAGNSIDFIAANSGYSGGLAFDGGGNVTAVPEPATYAAIAGTAVFALAGWTRRRQRKRAAPSAGFGKMRPPLTFARSVARPGNAASRTISGTANAWSEAAVSSSLSFSPPPV